MLAPPIAALLQPFARGSEPRQGEGTRITVRGKCDARVEAFKRSTLRWMLAAMSLSEIDSRPQRNCVPSAWRCLPLRFSLSSVSYSLC